MEMDDLSVSSLFSQCNLKFLSKIAKHSMLNQFSDHCKQYNLIPDYQSAYRENYLRKNGEQYAVEYGKTRNHGTSGNRSISSFQHSGSSGAHKCPEEQIWNQWCCPSTKATCIQEDVRLKSVTPSKR